MVPTQTAQMTDRRKQKRYYLEAPVTFNWRKASGQQFEVVGMTRDVNTIGAFICSANGPAVGTSVQLEIELRDDITGLKMLLETRGSVIRIASANERAGFALSFHEVVLYEDKRTGSHKSLAPLLT